MTQRLIETEHDIAEGCDHLVAAEPRFGKVIALAGRPPLRRRAEGFAELLGAIVSQQISVAAADGVWRRLEAAGATTPARIRAMSVEDLRACGLSRQKASYAQALAASGLDFDALRHAPDDQVVARLVELRGIGRWTAEIYAMFSLGRADVFCAGDLALQESARMLFALDTRPTERALRDISVPWAPWRAVAARLLWDYYRVGKDREGVR